MVQLLSVALKEKMRPLPACPLGNQPSFSENPFGLECKPAGFNDTTIDQFITENKDRPELQKLLSAATLTSDSIKMTPEASKRTQRIYLYIRLFPLAAAGIILLLSLSIAFLIPAHKVGYYVSGGTLLVPGMSMLSATLIAIQGFGNIVNQLILPRLPQAYLMIFQTYLVTLLRAVYFEIVWHIKLTSLIVIFVGILFIVIGKFLVSEKNVPVTAQP
jgi:hypothetical protein